MFGPRTLDVFCNAGLEPITPVRLEGFGSPSAAIWLKSEWTDPEGQDPLRSIKRKPACLLLGDILEKNYASDKKLLISATSGNFGIEIGMLATARGLPFLAVVPGAVPQYNLEVLKALGIDIIRTQEQETCPREYTVFFARGYADEFHHRLVNVEQYYHWLNPLAHSLTTAKEIFDTVDARVDHIVASVGSCGTICGIKQNALVSERNVNIVGVQPAIHHGVPGTHVIKGGCRWSPENYSPALIPHDKILIADSVDAYAYTAKLWEQGIPAGPSTGMALSQAVRMIEQGATGNIVVISPDNNFKYADLIVEQLEAHREEIIGRYPSLELEHTLTAYVHHLNTAGGLDRILRRVRECYPGEAQGQVFGVTDIDDIVTGAVQLAGP